MSDTSSNANESYKMEYTESVSKQEMKEFITELKQATVLMNKLYEELISGNPEMNRKGRLFVLDERIAGLNDEIEELRETELGLGEQRRQMAMLEREHNELKKKVARMDDQPGLTDDEVGEYREERLSKEELKAVRSMLRVMGNWYGIATIVVFLSVSLMAIINFLKELWPNS